MNVDDIYFPAINGDLVELERVLQANEVDLNAMLDAGVNNGVHTQFPLLFSVLNTMSQSGYNYQVLDMLIDYGVDLDVPVVLTTDAYTHTIPILAYVIRNWKSIELLEYLLKRGADSNAKQHERYRTHIESYTMLYFSIMFWDGVDAMGLLLQYGADPDGTIWAYEKDHAASQQLIPLFYTVVNLRDAAKTRMLFCFDASMFATIDTGIGWSHEFMFKKYLERAYPASVAFMETAYRQVHSKSKGKKVAQSHPKALQKEAPAEVAPSSTPAEEAPKPEELSDEDKLRKAARKLCFFDFMKASQYDRYVEDSKVKPGNIFNKKKREDAAAAAAAMAEEILNTRKEMVEDLNRLKDKVDFPVNDWWNTHDGFATRFYPNDRLVWMPFNRVVQRPNGYSLTTMFGEEMKVSPQLLKNFLRASDTEILYLADLDENQEYGLAELCGWSIYDAAFVYNEYDNPSESEVRKQMDAYSDELDDKERFRNMISGLHSTTNQELYMAGKMSDTLYMTYQADRERKYSQYEQDIRNSSHRAVKNADVYTQTFRPFGVVAFDREGKVAALASYRKEQTVEVYNVNEEKVICDFKHDGKTNAPEWMKKDILQGMYYYPMPEIDPISFAPQGIDPQGWLILIYASVCRYEEGTLQQQILKYYSKEASRKVDTVRYGSV